MADPRRLIFRPASRDVAGRSAPSGTVGSATVGLSENESPPRLIRGGAKRMAARQIGAP